MMLVISVCVLCFLILFLYVKKFTMGEYQRGFRNGLAYGLKMSRLKREQRWKNQEKKEQT